ncbi:hypothetical protein ABT215_09945 [Streptomyces sp900105755]
MPRLAVLDPAKPWIDEMREHYTRPKPPPRPLTGWVYDLDDLADVFGSR